MLLMFIYYPRSFGGFVLLMFIYYPRSFREVRVWRGSCYSCLYITPGLLEGSCLEGFVLLMFNILPQVF